MSFPFSGGVQTGAEKACMGLKVCMSERKIFDNYRFKGHLKKRAHGKKAFLVRLFHVLILFLCACSFNLTREPVEEETKEEIVQEDTLSQIRRSPASYMGAHVALGGEIIQTQYITDGTEICILEVPMEYWDMPDWEKHSSGRFIAESQDLLDPTIFKTGTKVTLSGEVTRIERRPLGKIEYLYPVIKISELHLWNKSYWSNYYDFWRWYRLDNPWYFPEKPDQGRYNSNP